MKINHKGTEAQRRNSPRKRGIISVSLCLGGLIVLLSACSGHFPEDRVPKMKILIPDFDVPPGSRETPREIRGWWLGARTIYQNPRAGAMFADHLTTHLARFPFVNLFSRVDLKYYFARKKQNLKEAYGYLTEEELAEAMRQVPKLDFARELGADKLLSGRIVRNFLSEHRTFHWWTSLVEVDCEMTDVLTGKSEWKKTYRLRKFLASQDTVQEELSRRVAQDLKNSYFRPLATSPMLTAPLPPQ